MRHDIDQHSVDAIVGSNIRRHRKDRRMKQEAVATAIGITHQQICRYETGSAAIPVPRLAAIAAFLNVDVADLLKGVVTKGGEVKITQPVDRRVDEAARAFKDIPPECMDKALKVIRLFAE